MARSISGLRDRIRGQLNDAVQPSADDDDLDYTHAGGIPVRAAGGERRFERTALK